jgi:hypothetical protein
LFDHTEFFSQPNKQTQQTLVYYFRYFKENTRVTALIISLNTQRQITCLYDIPRRIFGPKRDEVTGEWRKWDNEELPDLYSSPSIIRKIMSRRMT